MLNVKNDSLVLSAKKNGIDIFTRLEDKIVYHSLMGPPSLMYSRPE
jgi:hypothetical protein